MVNCAVPSCKNDSRRQTKQNSNVTFHRFPKNEKLLKKWVEALQRADWEPTIRSFVCSAHFPDSAMYFSKSGLRKLVQDAVPELALQRAEPHALKRKRKTSKLMPFKFVAPDAKRDKAKRKDRSEDEDCPVNQKLKKRIVNLTKLSKRRRVRCNALYASLNRIRKKVAAMTRLMQDLQQKISLNSVLGSALESSGVSTEELFKGLWKREKSQSPEPPEPTEEEDYFYSEIPNNIENCAMDQTLASKRRITVYHTSVPARAPSPPSPLDVLVSVKTESCSPGGEVGGGACRVCQLANVPLQPLTDDLQAIYDKLTGTAERGGGALCGACAGTLQRAHRLTAQAHRHLTHPC